MKKQHGGARAGAGRPKGSGKYGSATQPMRVPIALQQQVISLIQGKENLIPLYSSKISAGFPIPCDDALPEKLDFNEFLIKNPHTTFALRVNGDSMQGAGIFENDLLIVDRSLEARHNHVVVAAIDNALTVKRLCYQGKKIFLMPENDKYSPIDISQHYETLIWGVVIHVIRQL